MLRYLGPAPRRRRSALFVDRDGILNERVQDGYVLDVAALRPLQAAHAALRCAQDAGAALVVVTNQGAIGRGLVSEGQVLAIHGALIDFLATGGITIDAIYVCPHHPEAELPEMRRCSCRKPEPGMFLQAAADLDLDLARSAMIGDTPNDAAAAVAAGITDAAALTFSGDDSSALARLVRSHFAAPRPLYL